MVYSKSGRLHALVRKFSMSKLTHNRKIFYFQTAVLAEPSDHNSYRPGQNSKNFFLYNTRPHCVGLVRKFDPPPPRLKLIPVIFFLKITGKNIQSKTNTWFHIYIIFKPDKSQVKTEISVNSIIYLF
jgi:hypothetical protein